MYLLLRRSSWLRSAQRSEVLDDFLFSVVFVRVVRESSCTTGFVIRFAVYSISKLAIEVGWNYPLVVASANSAAFLKSLV